MEEAKRCIDCDQNLPLSAFGKSGKSGKYVRSYCRPCSNQRSRRYGINNKARRNERLREWRVSNPEAARAKDLRARLMRKYGLTPEDVEAMRAAQNERCLICRVKGELFVDHHHGTGQVRGLLCPSCNTFLGRVEANPGLLSRMAKYAGHDAPLRSPA